MKGRSLPQRHTSTRLLLPQSSLRRYHHHHHSGTISLQQPSPPPSLHRFVPRYDVFSSALATNRVATIIVPKYFLATQTNTNHHRHHFSTAAATTTSQTYKQIGTDIIGGQLGNEFGRSLGMSANGKTIAVSAPYYDSIVNGKMQFPPGNIRVFTYSSRPPIPPTQRPTRQPKQWSTQRPITPAPI